MAPPRRDRLPHVPFSLLLLAAGLLLAAVVAAAADAEDEKLRISVHYPTEEESAWLDRWAEKYSAREPGSGFSVQPATDEESAYLNRIFSDSKKDGGARGGFDGHIAFEGNRPRIVVDKYHSSSDKTKGDLKKNEEEESHLVEVRF
ncbi:hypothetical protein HU200_058390 [Digitaria exilis]|uniref:Uncharacterized protein n=1 Tax=Digitaria exilis TaxID=1010633 RepID=A0A835AI84_9POAL|nr:hypothetical protein HU200_058390 [Digitaria exilis]